MILDIRLSPRGIDEAIKALRRFQKELPQRVNALIDKMTKFGEDYAINAVGHVDTGETLNSIIGYRRGKEGVIVAGGNAIWLEFGTGVTYNGAAGGSPHPMGTELGMTIGSYGNGHGADPEGWYYRDGEGEKWKHTFGIQANMFMYRTAQALKEVFPDLAKEVFGGD